MAKDPDTILEESMVGQRLSRMRKSGAFQLTCNGSVFPLVSKITIGRGAENMIALDDSLVSRRHAVIQKIKDGYFIRDLDSSNGTFVNGQAVPKGKYLMLAAKDLIVVGRTELRVT